MKNNKIIIGIVLIAFLVIGATVFFANKGSSEPAKQPTLNGSSIGVYLDPSMIDTKVGNSFSVAVKENSSQEPVNVVSLKISYDPTILQYDSFENSSAFVIAAETKENNGVVTVVRATTDKKTGENTVGNIKFKSIKSGQSKLDTAGSEIVSASTNQVIDLQFGAATINVK